MFLINSLFPISDFFSPKNLIYHFKIFKIDIVNFYDFWANMQTFLQKYPSLLAIILVTGYGLTGCSTTQIAYNYADWLLLNRIDHYFDVTSTQKALLKQQLKQHFAWHRQSELPLYVDLLTTFKAKAQDGLTEEELEWTFDSFKARRQQLFSRLLPDTANFLATLSPAQIDYFEKKVIKQQRKVERSDEEIQKRLEERAEKYLEKMESWFGSFSKTQRYRIKRLTFAIPDIKDDWDAYRQMRRKELIAFLREKPEPAEIEALLKPWLSSVKATSPPPYREKFERTEKMSKAVILQIDQLITPTQRQKALKRLDKYIKDFQKLSR